jgi:hypothetical protein
VPHASFAVQPTRPRRPWFPQRPHALDRRATISTDRGFKPKTPIKRARSGAVDRTRSGETGPLCCLLACETAAVLARSRLCCFRSPPRGHHSRRAHRTGVAVMSERKSSRVKTVSKALKRVDEDTRSQVRCDDTSRFGPTGAARFSPRLSKNHSFVSLTAHRRPSLPSFPSRRWPLLVWTRLRTTTRLTRRVGAMMTASTRSRKAKVRDGTGRRVAPRVYSLRDAGGFRSPFW